MPRETWGDVFYAALRRGDDHGYAAYLADRWLERKKKSMAIQLDPKKDRALIKGLPQNIERARGDSPAGTREAPGEGDSVLGRRGGRQARKTAPARSGIGIDDTLCAAGWQDGAHAEYAGGRCVLTYYYWNIYSGATLGPYATQAEARAACLRLTAGRAGEGEG